MTKNNVKLQDLVQDCLPEDLHEMQMYGMQQSKKSKRFVRKGQKSFGSDFNAFDKIQYAYNRQERAKLELAQTIIDKWQTEFANSYAFGLFDINEYVNEFYHFAYSKFKQNRENRKNHFGVNKAIACFPKKEFKELLQNYCNQLSSILTNNHGFNIVTNAPTTIDDYVIADKKVISLDYRMEKFKNWKAHTTSKNMPKANYILVISNAYNYCSHSNNSKFIVVSIDKDIVEEHCALYQYEKRGKKMKKAIIENIANRLGLNTKDVKLFAFYDDLNLCSGDWSDFNTHLINEIHNYNKNEEIYKISLDVKQSKNLLSEYIVDTGWYCGLNSVRCFAVQNVDSLLSNALSINGYLLNYEELDKWKNKWLELQQQPVKKDTFDVLIRALGTVCHMAY